MSGALLVRVFARYLALWRDVTSRSRYGDDPGRGSWSSLCVTRGERYSVICCRYVTNNGSTLAILSHGTRARYESIVCKAGVTRFAAVQVARRVLLP